MRPTLGSLFSGFGGLDMAVSEVYGADTVWYCENDRQASKILAYREPEVSNLGDLTAVDWSLIEPPDILTGGFPCQDVSSAGLHAGMRPGTRSGLWSHMAEAIRELQPKLVVIENVRGILSARAHSEVEPCERCLGEGSGEHMRALGAVLATLADLGYDARWHGLLAAEVGAPHNRFRVFITAYPSGQLWERGGEKRAGGSQPANGDLRTVKLLPTPRAREYKDGFIGVDKHRPLSMDSLSRVLASEKWGEYLPAVSHWEHLTRPAPNPKEPAPEGKERLSVEFVEWMMGVPKGYVSEVPGLSRSAKLRALGNGVVPQQAKLALSRMDRGE